MSAATRTFERCIAVGGVAVFPADTVYGLACDPDDRFAVRAAVRCSSAGRIESPRR